MKFFNKFTTKTTMAAALVILASAMVGLGGRAHAACVQYDPNSSISTPVFNNFCNVPNGVGDEPNFVRIRQNANGNDKDNQNNPVYVNALNAACTSGDKFDVHTYIHNDAASGFNNNGAGSSVAHNVMLSMTAPLNSTNNHFSFTSSLSASNAASVQDSANLTCGSKQVKLTLVPSSVHIYSLPYGWNDLGDNAVNGTTKLGSPTLGSGDVWGCWDYRIIVVYQVTVQEVPPIPQTPVFTCDLLSVDKIADRSYSYKVTFTASNGATLKNFSYDFGDNTTVPPTTDNPFSHTYQKEGTFVTTVTVNFMVNGVLQTASSVACTKTVTVSPENCTVAGKENLPKNSADCVVLISTPPKPTSLPNTGPGNIVGIFAAVSIAGAFVHRYILSRRFNS